jgi:hypothetical protein
VVNIKRASVIFIIIFLSLICIGCNEYEGKDTVVSFGDGSIQLVKVFDQNFKKTNAIQDVKNQKTIEMYVYGYKEVDGKIFVKGSGGYTIVDIKSHEYVQKKSIDEFSKLEKDIFQSL